MDYGQLSPVGSSPYYGGMEQAKMVSVPTLKQRLDAAVADAENRLKAAKEAKEIFDRNPDIEKLLNIMQRGYF